MNHTSRRAWIASATAVGAAAMVQPAAAEAKAEAPRVRYSLNMSTIRGQKLSVPDQVDLAAKAGYDAIEPWIGELRQYQQGDPMEVAAEIRRKAEAVMRKAGVL